MVEGKKEFYPFFGYCWLHCRSYWLRLQLTWFFPGFPRFSDPQVLIKSHLVARPRISTPNPVSTVELWPFHADLQVFTLSYILGLHVRLLRNLYAGQEAIVRIGHGITDWFQIRKGLCRCCVLSLCLYMQTTSCEMPGWMKYKLESRLLGDS